jgi:ABC transport system ATP-binding/permease protein
MTVLLSLQGCTKSYGSRPLFRDLGIDLSDAERVGLIGPNGAGKSTLLKLLVGLEEIDDGVRSLRRGTRLGYVAQDDVFPAGQTVREVLLEAMAKDPIEDHERETRAAITLAKVGFDDEDKVASTLSGGWRKRLSLARELVCEPDLLLLDEPTNHLDLQGIVWLERLLREAPFGYLVATHDRAFLRAVADEVIEINRVYPSGSFRIKGTYDDFLDRRDDFLEGQARTQQAVANQVRRETEWLGRKAAARTRKAASRIDAAMNRREELGDLKYRNNAAGSAAIDFVGTGRQTRKLLTITGVSKSLGGRPLFSGLELMLSPGTKLGLLGPNGSGKSTFLKVLTGELAPDSGTVVPADNLKIVTFEQGRATLDLSLTLRKALCPNGDTVMVGDRPTHVVAWAKKFLFKEDQLEIQVAKLSGGEQARIRIAQLLLQPADLLLLDEPTNDLDIPALEVLEASLAEFSGALVVVSHDRELLDGLCTEVIGLDGQGRAALYGNVNQWLTALERDAEAAKKPAPALAPRPAPTPSQAKPRRMSNQEQKELGQIESVIAKAEGVLEQRKAAVQDAATAGHIALSEACRHLEASQREVDKLYARWQELEGRRG